MKNKDEKYMQLALKEANIAYNNGDIPVGCVIVYQDKVIAKAHNNRQSKMNTLGHAELVAISKACKKQQAWILEDATMYVTLEPCLMCTGAILNSRIKRVVYAAKEPKFGTMGSVCNVLEENKFNHQVIIENGVLEKESSVLLKQFFKELREKKNNKI